MKKFYIQKKTNIFKKILFLILRKFQLEVFEQKTLSIPTLRKNFDQNLSNFNKNYFILPFQKTKISREIKSLTILFRSCENVMIYDSSKKRVFEEPKKEYSIRSFNSIIKSCNSAKKEIKDLKIKVIIIDDNSSKSLTYKYKEICKKNKINSLIFNLNINEFDNLISKNVSKQTFANLASLYKSFLLAKKEAEDLIYFVEDDYIHSKNTVEEMLYSYQKLVTETRKEIFLCPTDYPFLYNNIEATKVVLGSKRHWRLTNQTLCTFLTSKKLLLKYWKNFIKLANKRNDPFEKPLDEIYKKEMCFTPLPSLAFHCTNIKSTYGLSPYINWRLLWNENKIND